MGAPVHGGLDYNQDGVEECPIVVGNVVFALFGSSPLGQNWTKLYQTLYSPLKKPN